MALEKIDLEATSRKVEPEHFARWLASLEPGAYAASDLAEDYRERYGPMDHFTLGTLLGSRGLERTRARLPDGTRPRVWVVPERT